MSSLDHFAGGYNTNLNNTFHFELHDEDILVLLNAIDAKPHSLLIININLVPINLGNNFIEDLSTKLKDEASKQYNNFITKSVKKEEPVKDNKKGGKSKGKGGKGKKDYDDDEENDPAAESYIRLTPQFKEQIKASFFKLP
jgi:hypothetical protein